MSRKRLAFIALTVFGLAACNGGSSTPPPVASSASQTAQPVTLSSAGAVAGTNAITGVTSNVTVAGSGAVAAGESFTLPSGVPALQLARSGSVTTQSRAKTQDIAGNPILYITL